MKSIKHSILITMMMVAVLLLLPTANALAFTDMSGQTTAVQNAVNKLETLNILEGYPDGTIRPQDTITRAEFAKIACVTAGVDSELAGVSTQSTTFTDVKSGAWYTQWINLAVAKGYLVGYETGGVRTFRPGGNITQQEALTVLLRIAGYSDLLGGTWPANYISKADDLGIINKNTFVGAKSALRSECFVLADNALASQAVIWNVAQQKFVSVGDSAYLKGTDGKALPITLQELIFGYCVLPGVPTDAYANLDGSGTIKILGVDNKVTTFQSQKTYAINNTYMGSFGLFELLSGKVIGVVDPIIPSANSETFTIDDDTIKINGKTYTITDDTVFFNSRYSSYKTLSSTNFISASVAAPQTIMTANKLLVSDISVIKTDGSNLVMVYMVNGRISQSGGIGVIESAYYSGADMAKLLGGATFKVSSSGQDAIANTAVFYHFVNGDLYISSILLQFGEDGEVEDYTDDISPYTDAYWLLDDGTTDSEAGSVSNISVVVDSVNGDTVIVNGHNYLLDASVIVYTANQDGEFELGSTSDIVEGAVIYALTTEDPQDDCLQYVFVPAREVK